MIRIFWCGLILIGCIASAQQSVMEDSLSTLAVTTTYPGAEIFLGSRYLGKTPLMNQRVPSGVHVLRLYSPSATAWNALVYTDTLRLAAGVPYEKHVPLGKLLSLHSLPFGGKVFYEGKELGITPLRWRLSSDTQGTLSLQKEGFLPEKIIIDGKTESIVVTLRPEEPSQGRQLPDVLNNHHNGLSRPFLTYTAAGTMVVSGIISAALKQRANQDFDNYLRTKDPALLASTRRLDRQAGITFALTQISFALLTYLLLSE
ncbi:MAG: PEGA domain-containing protein [bacterium]